MGLHDNMFQRLDVPQVVIIFTVLVVDRKTHTVQSKIALALHLAAKAACTEVVLLAALLRLIVALQLGAVSDPVAQASTVQTALQTGMRMVLATRCKSGTVRLWTMPQGDRRPSAQAVCPAVPWCPTRPPAPRACPWGRPAPSAPAVSAALPPARALASAVCEGTLRARPDGATQRAGSCHEGWGEAAAGCSASPAYLQQVLQIEQDGL
jgi:hypothetical protein